MLFIPLFGHCKSSNTCSSESCLRLRVNSHWLLRSWPRFVLMSILASLSCFSQSKILSLHLTLPKRSHVRGEAHVPSVLIHSEICHTSKEPRWPAALSAWNTRARSSGSGLSFGCGSGLSAPIPIWPENLGCVPAGGSPG